MALISLTVYVAQQVQETRQRASTTTQMVIVASPGSVFPGDSIIVSWGPQSGGTAPTAAVTQPVATTAPISAPAPTTGPTTSALAPPQFTSSSSICKGNDPEVTISWGFIPGVTSYTIYRKYPSESNWTLLSTINVYSFTDTPAQGLTLNSLPRYKVVAIASQYTSEAEVTIPTSPVCPEGPTPFRSQGSLPAILRGGDIAHAQGATAGTTMTGAETLQLINATTGALVGKSMYLNCQTQAPLLSAVVSGQCTMTVPYNTPVGSYVVRMIAADKATLMGMSSAISVVESLTMPIYRITRIDNSMFFWASPAQKDSLLDQTFNNQLIWGQNPVIVWYGFPSAQPNTVPVYRLVRADGTAFYWATATEKDRLLAETFNGEKVWDQNPVIEWYAYSSAQPNTVPIYRLVRVDGSAFYWATADEKDQLLAQTFNNQPVWNQTAAIVWYAYASPQAVPTPTPTMTPVPTATPIPTVTPIPTATPIPTVTKAPTATPVPAHGNTAPTDNPAYQWHYDPNN